MSNASNETLLASLNAAEVSTGSVITGTAAVYLGTSSPKWTGGITLTNRDSTIVLWYRVSPFATGATVALAIAAQVAAQVAAAVNGTTSRPLPAGGQAFIPVGDLARISVIAESGTPYVGWDAVRLF